MAQEKEIKIILKIPLVEFIKRIQHKGFKLLHTLNQTDIYFDAKDWFLYENIAALRLRQIDSKDYSFSFKKVFYLPTISDYFVEEIEVKYPFKDFSMLKQILGKINIPFEKSAFKNGQTLTKYLEIFKYFDEQHMPKIRTVYLKGDDEITIDKIDNVGLIVELECLNNSPHRIIETLLNADEWERSIEGTSYIWLKNVKGLTSHIGNLKKFKKTPDWNVWKNERDYFKKLLETINKI